MIAVSTLRTLLYGDDSRRIPRLFVTTFLAAAGLLIASGIVGRWLPATVGELAVIGVFVLTPAAVGVVSGWYRFGAVSAIAGGIAPPAAAMAVIPLGIGTLGGGDLTTLAFAVMMAVPSLVAAGAGFGVGTVIRVVDPTE